MDTRPDKEIVQAGPAALAMTGIVSVTAVVMAVADILFPQALPGWPFAALVIVYLLINWRQLSRGSLIILSAAIVVSLAALAAYGARLDEVFHRAGFFFALLIGLGLLGRIAARSPDFSKGAAILISRPPGLRYLFLTFGTHMLGVVVNFGSVIMMMSLLSTRVAELEKKGILRSLSLAVMRGFASTPMWSPLSLAPIVALSAVDNVEYWEFLPFGIAIALFYMATGYFLDATGGPREAPLRSGLPDRAESVVLLRVCARVGALVFGTLALSVGFGWRMIDAVMLAVMSFALVWLLAQKLSRDGKAIRPGQDVAMAGQSMVNEVVIVSGASIIGSAGALFVQDLDWFAAGIPVGAAAAVAFVIPWLIVGAAMLAINPIVTCTLLVETLQGAWPADSNLLLVMAIITGWGTAAAGTPYTANLMVGSRLIGRPSFEVAVTWNGRLTLTMLCLFSVLYGVLVLTTA